MNWALGQSDFKNYLAGGIALFSLRFQWDFSYPLNWKFSLKIRFHWMLFTSYDSACVNAFCNRDPMDLRGCKTMSDFQKEKMISCRIPMNRCNMAQVRFLFIKRFTSGLKYLFGFFFIHVGYIFQNTGRPL